jgi:catechol 2,3-dioxygenase-like lactoylglutathione lyase family enzyme
MRLNHLDLHVADVAATRDFLVHHFGFRHIETRGRDGLAILQDAAGLELVISHPLPKFGGADAASVDANTFHIGFILAEKAEVDRLYERLCAAQAELWHAPQTIRGGWMFYCMAPGRILIEVGWRPDH